MNRSIIRGFARFVFIVLLALFAVKTLAAVGTTERVSVDSTGTQANGESSNLSISADGRFVAFDSWATNLVAGDTNLASDIFVHDRQTGTTEMVSVNSDGIQANKRSNFPSISADGRFVAFDSSATNLVDGILGMHIYVHDRLMGTTELVSVDSSGRQANQTSQVSVISANGRFVAFASHASNLVAGDTNGTRDIFVHDRQTGMTERMSVDSTGTQANSYSDSFSSISADGRFVAFTSWASNLVDGDTNGAFDIFVHDRQTGTTERVSVDSTGTQADNQSGRPSISADGRFVAFKSCASNLVAGDTNLRCDIFVHDRQTGTTERVSVDSTGAQANHDSSHSSISADGRFVAFVSRASNLVDGDTNGMRDIFIHDRQTGLTKRVNVDSNGVQANGNSGWGTSLSADGRFVAFLSLATNLVAGDTNDVGDIFVHDQGIIGDPPVVDLGMDTEVNKGDYICIVGSFVDVDSSAWTAIVNYGDGTGDQVLSIDPAEHSFVLSHAYTTSGAYEIEVILTDDTGKPGSDTVQVTVHDVISTTIRVSVDSANCQANNASTRNRISADGRFVAFESWASNLVDGDTNDTRDIFVYDRQTGMTERVNVDSTGVQANDDSLFSSINADGRFVAFLSVATNLVAGDTNGTRDVFVHDRQTGTTERVSVDSTGVQGNGISSKLSISADGRFVAFESWATNLVSGDTNGTLDIFVHDRQTGTTERVSVNSTGAQANNSSYFPSISADGRFVAFSSDATNLADGDTNLRVDIFVHDRQTGTTERVSVDSTGVQANDDSMEPSISADGRYVVFHSNANNLVFADMNSDTDVFVHDRQTGTTELVSVDNTGTQANQGSFGPEISANGRFVAFGSWATNLVDGDTNGSKDMFVHDRRTGLIERVNVDSNGIQADSHIFNPSISGDGRFVAFSSRATNLVIGDTNGVEDVFVHTQDVDWDGIFDDVDTMPNTASDDFSDIPLGGTTIGMITDHGDQVLTITEEPSPDGVRITADASGGITPATVTACGGASQFSLSPGDEVVVTCGSVTIEVISGTVEITFIADDGTLATTSLTEGNTLTFDQTTVTFTAAATNSGSVVVLVNGQEISLAPGKTVRVVDIDIKPGSDPNSINCTNENEVITVAFLATETFDATTVDHTTVTFEGASETRVDKKSGEPRRHEEDVDGDGDIDLVFHFRLGDTSLTCVSTEGTIVGETFDGLDVEGTDSVNMIDGGGG